MATPYEERKLSMRGSESQARANAAQVRDLMPEEDFSPRAVERREAVEFEAARDQLRASRQPADDPRAIAAQKRFGSAIPERGASAAVSMAKVWKNHRKDLEKFPSLAKALVEAQLSGAVDLTEQDIAKMINVKQAEAAAKMLLQASAIGDKQRQKNILFSASPVMRQAILDIADYEYRKAASEVEAQAAAEARRMETAGPTEKVVDTLGNIVGGMAEGFAQAGSSVLGGMTAAWEKTQQAIRAMGYASPEAMQNPLATVFAPARIPINWDKVAVGQFDEEYIQTLRDSGGYDPLAVDILLDISRATADGVADPIIATMMSDKYIDDANANKIFRTLIYRETEDPKLQELARQIDSANNGSSGQLLMSSLFSPPSDEYDPVRGTLRREMGANVATIGVGLLGDPFLGLSKARNAYLGARYALMKLAPGQDIAEALAPRVVAGVETNASRRYFSRLADDIVKLDEMATAGDEVGVARLRQVMARQYADLPDDVIEEFRAQNVRNIDDVVRVIEDQNNMFLMLQGDVPSTINRTALPKVILEGGIVGRIMEAGRAGRREALMPRVSFAGELRQGAARILNARFMPATRSEAVIASQYANLDPETVANTLNEQWQTIGRIDQQVSGIGGAGRTFDRITRLFASLPNKGFISIDSSVDSGVFYKFARTFLTKRHADVLTEAFRQANPGQRRLMVMGLVRTGAASRGVNLSKDEVVAKIDELVTGTRQTEKYAPDIVQSPSAATEAADDMSVLGEVEGTVTYNPAVVNGQTHALHVYQNSKAVSIPTLADIEAIRQWRANAPKWIQRFPQGVTDIWSLGTLYGFRYSQRSMIEDMWAYAITGGRLSHLISGRKASTAIREARPMLRLKKKIENGVEVYEKDANGDLIIELDSRLGMFAKRFRGIGWKNQTEANNGLMARVFGEFFIRNLDNNQIVEAYAAARQGNMGPMQNLVGLAFAKQRIRIAPEDEGYILRLMDGPMGLKILDDMAETGRYINQGSYPIVTGAVDGLDADGVQLLRVEPDTKTVFGKYINVPMDQPDSRGVMFWHRNLLAVVEYDGPIGKIAVANLRNRDLAAQRVAEAIMNDTTYGYRDNFSMLYTGAATVEEFARRYVDDVYNTFSRRDGSLNEELLNLVTHTDENGRRIISMSTRGENGERIISLSQQRLSRFDVDNRPRYVLGREVNVVPNITTDAAFFTDKAWGWMGEQYARISREPIFLANYIEQSRFLAEYEAQIARTIGAEAASRVTGRMALDRAYQFTLSYMDNPKNRSMLAWKVRNVARYYRATEDFYRRMQRVAKNYPQGFWRTALTYQLLDDTGFVYTDSNGDKYFAYPGNEFLMGAINTVTGVLTGQGSINLDPFFIGGKVKMLAPSSDPKQWVPYPVGPMGVVPFKLLFDRFPSLQGFEKYVTGEYSVSASYWDAVVPASIMRVIKASSQDERDSMYGAAMLDAIAIAVANNLISPDVTSFDQIKQSDAWPVMDRIVKGALGTRLIMSFFVPASPQLYVDNVTAYARANGLDSMRDGYLDLVKYYAENGNEAEKQNPMGAALARWYKLHPDGNLMPFTVSKTEAKDTIRSMTGVQASDELVKWYGNNKDLYKKYPDVALFLAPRSDEFSWDSWSFITNELDMRQDKDFETFVTDVLASKAEFEYFATIDDYAQDIEQIDPTTDDGRKMISELEKQRKADLDFIRASNPWLDDKTPDWGALDRKANDAYQLTRKMVVDLEESGKATEVSSAIYSAILTYEDYMTEIKMITGTTNADDQKKRVLRYALQKDLNYLSDENENVRQFVKSVLNRTPDMEKIVKATGGA